MKTTEAKVRKLLIEEIEHLDPVTVYLEDFELGKGKITISCYDETWSSFWGAMGGRTISEFFRSCDNDYLCKNLSSSIPSQVVDEDESKNWLRKELVSKRRCRDVEKGEAKEMWNEIENIDNPKEWAQRDGPLSRLLFEGEWWYADFPEMPNPKYVYLCRIIDAVKEALRIHSATTKGELMPTADDITNGKTNMFYTKLFYRDTALETLRRRFKVPPDGCESWDDYYGSNQTEAPDIETRVSNLEKRVDELSPKPGLVHIPTRSEIERFSQ